METKFQDSVINEFYTHLNYIIYLRWYFLEIPDNQLKRLTLNRYYSWNQYAIENAELNEESSTIEREISWNKTEEFFISLCNNSGKNIDVNSLSFTICEYWHIYYQLFPNSEKNPWANLKKTIIEQDWNIDLTNNPDLALNFNLKEKVDIFYKSNLFLLISKNNEKYSEQLYDIFFIQQLIISIFKEKENEQISLQKICNVLLKENTNQEIKSKYTFNKVIRNYGIEFLIQLGILKKSNRGFKLLHSNKSELTKESLKYRKQIEKLKQTVIFLERRLKI